MQSTIIAIAIASCGTAAHLALSDYIQPDPSATSPVITDDIIGTELARPAAADCLLWREADASLPGQVAETEAVDPVRHNGLSFADFASLCRAGGGVRCDIAQTLPLDEISTQADVLLGTNAATESRLHFAPEHARIVWTISIPSEDKSVEFDAFDGSLLSYHASGMTQP